MHIKWSFPGGARGKESASQCRKYRRQAFDLWIGKIPWKKKWQPTPVSLPGESHGQRNLAGYSPWGRRELDNTEAPEHHHISYINYHEFIPPQIQVFVLFYFSISFIKKLLFSLPLPAPRGEKRFSCFLWVASEGFLADVLRIRFCLQSCV